MDSLGVIVRCHRYPAQIRCNVLDHNIKTGFLSCSIRIGRKVSGVLLYGDLLQTKSLYIHTLFLVKSQACFNNYVWQEMSETLWPLDEQTVGKHRVLQHYLDGWFPILGSSNGRLLFIDGFAGPGEYADGGQGSPIIALDCIRKHKQKGRLKGVAIVCLFIESDTQRACHLKELLKQQPPVSETKCYVLEGMFDDHMTALLNYIDEQKMRFAPAFVMIDPFGVKGSRIELIERILQNNKSECFISFMYEPIRRFHKQPEFEPHLNELFGTKKWKECLDMEESETKKGFLHGLFATQLKKKGAKYVVAFELWKSNRHIYTIYFTSGSSKGCNLMKEAMWKVEPSGSFAFRGYTSTNQVCLPFGTNTEPLAKQLKEKFGNAWTPVEQIEEFVMSDQTMFHKGHLRRQTLRPLESQKLITVNRPPGVKGFPSKKGIEIRFN